MKDLWLKIPKACIFSSSLAGSVFFSQPYYCHLITDFLLFKFSFSNLQLVLFVNEFKIYGYFCSVYVLNRLYV